MIKKFLVFYLLLTTIFGVGVSHVTTSEQYVSQQVEVTQNCFTDDYIETVQLVTSSSPQQWLNVPIFNPHISVRYKFALFSYQSYVTVQLRANQKNQNNIFKFILPHKQITSSNRSLLKEADLFS